MAGLAHQNFMCESLHPICNINAVVFLQNNRTCFKPEEGDVAKEFDRLGISFFLIKGLTEGMRASATDSYSSLLKCWWNDKEIGCNGKFFNHYTDYGWCFTFNPNMSGVAFTTSISNGTIFHILIYKSVNFVFYNKYMKLVMHATQSSSKYSVVHFCHVFTRFAYYRAPK